jgi:lysozyme
MAITGIDVSEHQGSVDFAKVKATGIDFVICKTSEGQDFHDKRWTRTRADAIRHAGLKVGVYHFVRPRAGRHGSVEAKQAVKTAVAAGWGKPGDLRLVADIEVTDLHSPAATHAYLAEFVAEAVELTGHGPLIYTFPSFWTTSMANRSNLGCELWIAHFGVAQPTVPAPWHGKFAIHQHSSTGHVNGVGGDVDLNRVPVGGELPTIPKDKPKPKPKPLTRRQKIVRRFHRARRVYLRTHANAALRVMLISKARLGMWDDRFAIHFGVSTDVSAPVRKFITRGYAAGLVPTSTVRAPRFVGDNSYHIRHKAADMGLRRDEIGTAKGAAKRERFQAAEWARRHKTNPTELIGPINDKIVLNGHDTSLAEGSPLEDQHDDHVHGAWA